MSLEPLGGVLGGKRRNGFDKSLNPGPLCVASKITKMLPLHSFHNSKIPKTCFQFL